MIEFAAHYDAVVIAPDWIVRIINESLPPVSEESSSINIMAGIAIGSAL